MIGNKQWKIDLHVHSIISYDGGVNAIDIEKTFSRQRLHCIAITDHNQISFAQAMHKRFGERIIVGEEIKAIEGEIIGLFLEKIIPPGLTARKTITMIHEQNGLVYIPHPFETQRKGLQKAYLEDIREDSDIFEVFNARAWLRDRSNLAYDFASDNNIPMAASSDAHSLGGIGTAYSRINQMPTRQTLKSLLRSGTLQTRQAPIYSLLSPTINKIRHALLKNYDQNE